MHPLEHPKEETFQPPLAEKLQALHSVLGEEQKPLIEEPVQGKPLEDAKEGYAEISEKELVADMAELLQGEGLNTFRKLVRYRTDLNLLAALRSWKKLSESSDPQERTTLTRAFLIANQEASYYQYLGEAAAVIERQLGRVGELRQRCAELQVPVPQAFDEQERLALQFVEVMRQSMAARVRMGNALTARWLLQQKNDIEKTRTPANPQEAVQMQTDRALAESVGLAQMERADVERREQEAIAALTSEERTLLNGGNPVAVAEHLNALEQELLSVMTGKKEQTGLPADFNVSVLYRNLWNALDEELWRHQSSLVQERNVAMNPDTEPGSIASGGMEQYIKNARAELQRHLAGVTWENGGFQFILLEIAEVQNQFGKHLNTAEAGQPDPVPAPPEADLLDGWLEQRGEVAEGHIRLSLEAAENMLDITLPETTEDWAKTGDIIVADIAERVGRVATFWIPSETDESAAARAYRLAAEKAGMPRSREAKMEELADPIKEALGIPAGKTWNQLSVREQEIVMERCRSIVDVKKDFNRQAIANVRRSLDLLDGMPKATSPEMAGQETDMALLVQVEQLMSEGKLTGMGERIDRDMTGMTVEGKTVNRATAFQLILRQAQRDWGDPEKGTGFMGEYLTYLQSLEGNVQHHLDVAGALFQMQKAWEQYAFNLAKAAAAAAAAGVLSPLIIAALAAAGGAASRLILSGGKFAIRGALRGTRAVAGLAEAAPVRVETTNALLKMRYLTRERQLTQMLENTRAGKFVSRLNAVKNLQAVRYGGNMLKVAGWAAVPATTAYELYLTHQRVEGAEGNPALQEEYAEGYSTSALAGAGVGAALAAPGVVASFVLSAPVLWAANYRSNRTERKAAWEKEVADYNREFDAAGLRQLLVEYAPGTETAAGGGSVYYPRPVGWLLGRADQEAATEMAAMGNAGARGRIFEAYFTQNLIVPPEAREEQKQAMVRDKMTYIHDVTHNGYENVGLYELQKADAYAQLQKIRRELLDAGEPALLSYFDAKGERQWINLEDLTTPRKGEVVIEYMRHMLPIQELVLFNAQGEMAREHQNPTKRREEFRKAGIAVRRMILMKTIHHVHEMERIIREKDWPGVDVPLMSKGNTEAQNVVRWYLAALMEEQLAAGVGKLLYGQMLPDAYEAYMHGFDTLMNEVREAVAQDPGAFATKARAYIEGRKVDVEAVQDMEGNPLYEMLGK